MWFIKQVAVPHDGTRPINVLTELVSLTLKENQRIYPTMFFNHFQGVPIFNTFSDIPVLEVSQDEQWDRELERVLGKEKLDDLLKEKEVKERITTA